MRIDVITKYEDFLALKETWNSLYEKDPDAQFFLSWTFLSTYIRRYEGGWFILAARLGGGRPLRRSAAVAACAPG